MASEDKMTALLARATRDRGFREEFLANPGRVGKRHGVAFTKTQLKSIKETTQFIENVEGIVLPQPQPVYPLDPYLYRWKIDELLNTIRIIYDPRPIYPMPYQPIPKQPIPYYPIPYPPIPKQPIPYYPLPPWIHWTRRRSP